MNALVKEYLARDVHTTPHACDAAYVCPAAGADLDAIESFTAELTDIVDRMQEELVHETRILEGMEVPQYENGLSDMQSKDDQWTTDLQNGFLKIVRTRVSELDSSNSPSSARPSSPVSLTHVYGEKSLLPQTGCCREKLGACGCETDATNECSECTVPMISELTPGTLSELK
jgi:hypothetical protein